MMNRDFRAPHPDPAAPPPRQGPAGGVPALSPLARSPASGRNLGLASPDRPRPALLRPPPGRQAQVFDSNSWGLRPLRPALVTRARPMGLAGQLDKPHRPRDSHHHGPRTR